ncbi:ABC transporter ATP-binding protein [Paenisporosarcina indica]|uniref:ABC transporter ATP-binding protein n=1 Tax=Paenisporosarcina indica TaxID=650093 RepID=UPI00094FB427|nr:ABC transporter ATP-binding protein [Paenisporosarcina indica]
MSALLEANQLTKIYGKEYAVNQLNFVLEEGTATALIGPNGAGKTTTLSMLAGLLKPTQGSISLNGEQRADVRESIGFLPQYPQFFSWLTALEFTEMAAKLSGMETRSAKLEAQKTLEFVGLGEALRKKTGTFSGGMKQRLGLAQAIVHRPKLLLLDEPVSALDPVGRREIMNLLKSLQQNMTILYSTHILNDAEEMTDQLLFLRKGRLVEKGSIGDVRAKYDHPRYRVEFGSAEDAKTFSLAAPWHVAVEGTIGFIDIIQDMPVMSDMLKLLGESGLDIRKAERQTASLEEIFMKVAGQA